MNRRAFLPMAIPAAVTGCMGLSGGPVARLAAEGGQVDPTSGGSRDGSSSTVGGFHRRAHERHMAIHRRFMERARDRREAAKKRRDRRDRARRRRRTRSV